MANIHLAVVGGFVNHRVGTVNLNGTLKITQRSAEIPFDDSSVENPSFEDFYSNVNDVVYYCVESKNSTELFGSDESSNLDWDFKFTVGAVSTIVGTLEGSGELVYVGIGVDLIDAADGWFGGGGGGGSGGGAAVMHEDQSMGSRPLSPDPPR